MPDANEKSVHVLSYEEFDHDFPSQQNLCNTFISAVLLRHPMPKVPNIIIPDNPV